MSEARMVRRRRVALGLGAVTVAVVAVVFLHYVPFLPGSFAAWGGIVLALVGAASLARPLRFVGVRSRRSGLLVLGVGVLVAVTAVLWPASVVQAEGDPQRIDHFLPEYQSREYHEARVRAPRERVEEVVRAVSLADMPAAVLLMRLRALAGGQLSAAPPDRRPILDMMRQPGSGFLPLDESDPGEIVYGMVGRPWVNEAPPPVRTAEDFLAYDEPGAIKVVFNIRVVEEGDGICRVSTETRTLGNDDDGRRVFGRYWRIVYPGSAIIRRVWLDAIISRARRSDDAVTTTKDEAEAGPRGPVVEIAGTMAGDDDVSLAATRRQDSRGPHDLEAR